MALPNLQELLTRLGAEHDPSDQAFRGQTRRFPPHVWTLEGARAEVESAYPSDYRFFTAFDQPTEDLERHVMAARKYGREVRDQFSAAVLVSLARDIEKQPWAHPLLAELEWGRANHRPPQDMGIARVAWSLAQHYAVATALVDVTFSLQVAAWFATQPWQEGAPLPAPGSTGVLYRFHLSRLRGLLEAMSAEMKGWASSEGVPPPPELFFQDIRVIPESFARRPRAQHGASLYGFDQPKVVFHAFTQGAVEAHEFVHQADEDPGVGRPDVIPSDDPFLAFSDRFQAFRKVMEPTTRSAPSGPDYLALMTTAHRLPLKSARERERFRIGEPFLGILYDEIEEWPGATQDYRYLFAVFHSTTHALACMVTAEAFEPLPQLKALPPEVLETMGLGGEALSLWDGSGRRVVDLGSFPTIESFKERALPLARQVLGLS